MTKCYMVIDMTRAEAEEIYLLELSLVNVIGGDIREKCRNRGVPEHFIDEFVGATNKQKKAYDQFFQDHDDSGKLKLTETDTVKRLQNFGIKAGKDKEGNRWIVLGQQQSMNSVVINLCKHLHTEYGYKYWKK